MLSIANLSYIHPNGDLLFDNVNLTINKQDKLALIGNNGTGKSVLMKILAGELNPSAGTVSTDLKPYFVPQHYGQFNHLTLAQALRIEHKLTALKHIVTGQATEADLVLLDDDWLLEERCT